MVGSGCSAQARVEGRMKSGRGAAGAGWELGQVAADYRLLRIRRQAARTGPGGPGDLSWVWPLATMVLLPLVLRRRRR